MTVTIQPPYEVKPNRFDLRLSLLFGMLFVPNAVHLAFFPIWLKDSGFSSVQIATLLSTPVLIRILATPPVTFYADRSPERALVLIAISGVSLFLSLFLFTNIAFLGILVLMSLLSAFWSPQVPLADSIALSGVRRFGIDYASVRVWGSVVFLAVNISAGFAVEYFGSAVIPPMIVGGFLVIFLASLWTPRLGRRRQLSDAGVLPTSSQSLKSPAVLTFLLATGLIQGSHGYLYSFGSIYWKDSGVSAQLVGFLWAVPVFAEIIMFKTYRRFFGEMRPEVALMVAGGVAVVRWVLFPFAGTFGFAGFFIVQLLHSFSFAMTYLAQQAYLAHAVPEEQAGAAQGLAVFVQGIIMAAIMFGSGPLYDFSHAKGFFVMAFIALGGIGLGYRFLKQHGEEA